MKEAIEAWRAGDREHLNPLLFGFRLRMDGRWIESNTGLFFPVDAAKGFIPRLHKALEAVRLKQPLPFIAITAYGMDFEDEDDNDTFQVTYISDRKVQIGCAWVLWEELDYIAAQLPKSESHDQLRLALP